MSRTHSSNKHLHQPVGDVRFIATVAFKCLGVELTRAITGHFDLLQPAGGCNQVAGVGAVAIPIALGAAFSHALRNELLIRSGQGEKCSTSKLLKSRKIEGILVTTIVVTTWRSNGDG